MKEQKLWTLATNKTDILLFNLRQLALDECPLVRCLIAKNRKAPASVLNMLASDEDMDVRIAVCKNPSTPINVVDFLSHDLRPEVRLALAENVRLPMSVLQALSHDKNERVRKTARHTLDSLGMPACLSKSHPVARFSTLKESLGWGLAPSDAMRNIDWTHTLSVCC